MGYNWFADLKRGPVSARVEFWVESAAEVKALVDESVTSGLRAADEGMFEEALAGAAARWKVPDPVVVEPPPWGEPGAVCANLLSSWEPTGRAWTLRYRDGPITRRRMDWIIDPDKPFPFGVNASMSRLDHRGVPASTGPDEVSGSADYSIHVRVWDPDPENRPEGLPPGWAVAVRSSLCGPGEEPAERRLRWVKEMAGHPGLRFAEVGWIRDRPSFEHVHGPTGTETSRIFRASEALRGYNWVTVLPAELVVQISAARLEEARRDLFEVESLPNGALWVRGTERFQGFYDQRLRQMFLLCAEVLPDGPMTPVVSRLPIFVEPTYPVVYEPTTDRPESGLDACDAEDESVDDPEG